MSIESILKSIQKTNPQMTEDRLIDELLAYYPSAAVLILGCASEKGTQTAKVCVP